MVLSGNGDCNAMLSDAFAFRIDTITSYNPYQNELELNIDFGKRGSLTAVR